MKISELIKELEDAKERYGDVQCLVEVISDGCVYMMPVGELTFEDREGYGESLSIIY